MRAGGAATSNVMPGDFTVATLPSATGNQRKYCWVIDLHDSQPDYVISDGSFWKPVRPLATRTVANANADATLIALSNAPTQIMQGTLSVARAVTLSTANAYRGAKFRVKREAGGLFSLVVNGIGLSLNSWADFEFDGTQWIQTASGGLL